MKKFISMVMAAAMVVSMVPATAFAATGDVTATARISGVAEMTEDEAKLDDKISVDEAPEVILKITDTNYKETISGDEYSVDVTLTLDNAEFLNGKNGKVVVEDTQCLNLAGVGSYTVDGGKTYTFAELNAGSTEEQKVPEITVAYEVEDTDEITWTFTGKLGEDDKISFNLGSQLTKTKEGTEATVSVSGDICEADALVYATILSQELKAKVKDTVDVAEEEIVELKKITIEAAVGSLPNGDKDGEDIKLKLSNGFEFETAGTCTAKDADGNPVRVTATIDKDNDDVVYLNVDGKTDKIEIVGMEIEATTAGEGDVATIKVSATDWSAATVEVATLVALGVTVSVDEDEDVPEMWSGVDAENTYLTSDDSHEALEVTIEETVVGSFDRKDEVEFVLPEGVYVTGVKFGDDDFEMEKVMEDAYNEGEYESFVFEKRTLEESSVEDKEDAFVTEFTLTLVADPGFVGDVVLEVLVDGESVGEVTIAKFNTPMVIEAQANDLIIDYRNTEVPTDIVVKEAEAGLWAEGLAVGFGIDVLGDECFEDDMVYTVNKESGMEVDGEDDTLLFAVDEESDDEAAVVTISNISLYMNRSLAAGAYDLEMTTNSAVDYFEAQPLFGGETVVTGLGDCTHTKNADNLVRYTNHVKAECDEDNTVFVGDVTGYSDVVKEGFVNIVTAGRDADDASFTTKVVVPVGESYIVAGENTVALDVPAYVSASGYTMLPVRAVAVALGILNNNVLWDQASKTVTILYGQRIITMTVGAKVINVNGSAIPASSSPEVVDGRTFLPMRDLATALGVTDITWDAATKTATLNGNK